MIIYKNQTDFTHGEIAPQLISRPDLKVYSKGAQKLRDVCVIPQGGAKRRFGLDYTDSFIVGTNEFMLVPFDYSETVSYLLVFTHNNIAVYYEGALQTNIPTTYFGGIFKNLELKYAQEVNSLVLVHPDYKPAQLSRGSDHTTWTLKDIDFKHVIALDFNDVDYGSSTFTLLSTNIKKNVPLTSTDAIFDDSYVGGLFIGIGPNLAKTEGTARITAFVSSTVLTVDIISNFDPEFSSGGMIGDNCFLGKPAWSNLKGYPQSVTFFEGRMFFGGTKSASQTLLASKVNDVFNFDEGDSSADDAFQISISTDKINTIKHLVSDKTLQIFTFSAEFAVLELDGKPLSADDVINIKQQTANGSSNVRPIVIDNQTLYVKKGGRIVYAYSFDQQQQAYNSTNISVMSSHLIRNPVDGVAYKNSSTDDFEFMFLINEDGTLAIYQTLADENISAWSLAQTVNNTSGKFKRVITVKDSVYFVIERMIDGVRVNYIEKLNWDHFTDSTKVINLSPASNVITGLDHLKGATVRVIGDEYVYGSYVVNSSGEVILLDGEGNPINISQAIVGLEYIPLIKPMPLSIESQNGALTYTKKRIVSVFVDYYNSLGIKIVEPGKTSGSIIPFFGFGENFPYPVPDPQTGFYEREILSTWDARQMIEITQDDPLPMTILGIGFKLDV